jgi:hypothetical protein
MGRHLSVVEAVRRDPGYWLHPVHQRPVTQADVLSAHFATEGEPPHMASLAASVLAAAVLANDRTLTVAVEEALETLGVFFSTPADDCPVFGIRRPDGVA